MPQFLPFDAVGTAAGDPNFPNMISGGGGGGAVEIREFFPTRGIVIAGTEFTGAAITTITLDDATHFPSSGNGTIKGPGNANTGGGAGGNQFSKAAGGISWTGKTGNTLTGISATGGDNIVNRSWLHNYTVIDLDTSDENIFTYTVPTDVTTLLITGVGGGGSGGNGTGAGTSGGGGASGMGGTVVLSVTAGQQLGVRVGIGGYSLTGQSSNVSTISTSTFTDLDAVVFPGGGNGATTDSGRIQETVISNASIFGTNGLEGHTAAEGLSDNPQEVFRTRGNYNTAGFASSGGGGGGFSIMSSGGVGANGAAHGGGGAGGGGGGGAGWFKGIPGAPGRASGGDAGIGTAGGHGGIRIAAFESTVTTITYGS